MNIPYGDVNQKEILFGMIEIMLTNGVNSPYFHILGTLQYGVSGIFTCEGLTLLQALLSVKGQKDLEKKVPQGHPLSQKEVFYALISRIYAVILSVDMTVSRLSYLIETPEALLYVREGLDRRSISLHFSLILQGT